MAEQEQINFEKPDYGAIHSADEIDGLVEQYRDRVLQQVREERRVEAEKRESNAEFNAQLKAIGEGLDHYIGVLDQLEDRRRKLIDKAKQADLPFEDPLPGMAAEAQAERERAADPPLEAGAPVAPGPDAPLALPEHAPDAEIEALEVATGPVGVTDPAAAAAPWAGPPADDGSLPFNDAELELLKTEQDGTAAAAYADRTGVKVDVARAEVQAWRSANKMPAEFVAPEPPPSIHRRPRGTDEDKPKAKPRRLSYVP
jgi:hypothetical protein